MATPTRPEEPDGNLHGRGRPEEPDGNLHVVQLTTVDHEILDCTGFQVSASVKMGEGDGLPRTGHSVSGIHQAAFVKLADKDTNALHQACALANPSLFATGCSAPICDRDVIGAETEYDGAALRFAEELAHVDGAVLAPFFSSLFEGFCRAFCSL